MLAHRLPGYKEKLEATGAPGEAVNDPAELFKALFFETPLPLLVSEVQAPERPTRKTRCPRSRRSRCLTS